MIVDPAHDRLVEFGGQNSAGLTADLWTRALADSGHWTRAGVAGPWPASKSDGTAVYDPVRHRMILFGGFYTDGVWALSLGDSLVWTQLAVPGSGPGDRDGARAIYDPVGDRLLTFGGSSLPSQNDVWAFALGDSSGWSRLSPAGTAPTTRTDGAVVYDSRRRRLLLFSGCDYSANSPQPPTVPDLWALSLEGAPTWTQLSASGDVPPGLYDMAAAYDSVHDQMVVYGGNEWAVGPHREAWVLDCGDSPRWTRVAPAIAPAARTYACLAYDPTRDRFVMFGGAGADTWALSLGAEPAWTLLEPGSDEPANSGYLSSSAYDPVQHQSLILGGFGEYEAEYSWWSVEFPNLWSFGPAPRARWVHVLPDSVAPAYVGESIVVDARADRAVVFSGLSSWYGTYGGLTQLSLADPRGWRSLDASGGAPLPRNFHSAIFDPVRDRMVVFGGHQYNRVFGDTWMLALGDSSRWTRMDSVTTSPPARFGQSTIYDPVGERMIIFGGMTSAGSYGDLWQLSLGDSPAWSPLSAGVGPSPRYFASMVYDSRRQRIVLIGGRGQDGATLGDVWFLPLASGAVWTRADLPSIPSGARWGAAATYDPDRDVVLIANGADDPCEYRVYGDTWVLHPADPAPATIQAAVPETDSGGVTLTWSGLPTSGCTGSIQRRTNYAPWVELGMASPDGAGRLSYVDHSAAQDGRFDYRLQWAAGAVAGTSVDTWVNVASLRFALASTTANPSREGLSVAFSLPDASPAQIIVCDIAGRQVARQDVGALGPGSHRLQLAAPGVLRPGIYLVRMRHAGASLVVRASVLK